MPAPQGHKPFNTNSEGGRPKIYTDEFIENEANEFEAWMQQPAAIYFKRFAINRGYHPNRLSEFAEQNQRFSGVYEQAKAWQEVRLVEGGLIGEFHSSFCKLAMGNLCGWSDRQESKLSCAQENPLAALLKYVHDTSKDLVTVNE